MFGLRCCQGARQIRKSDIRTVFVFISPPSEEELEKRLRGRGTESEQQIHLRLKTARQEIERYPISLTLLFSISLFL